MRENHDKATVFYTVTFEAQLPFSNINFEHWFL